MTEQVLNNPIAEAYWRAKIIKEIEDEAKKMQAKMDNIDLAPRTNYFIDGMLKAASVVKINHA